MSDIIVQCQDVNVSLGGRLVMKGLSMAIHQGDFTVVVGSNGSGKSSLLKLLRQQLLPSTGKISHAPSLKGRIAYCSQSTMDQLCGSMTVLEHLSLYHPKMSFAAVKDYLAACHPTLAEHIHTPVGEFSGGEQQSLALALIVLSKPKLLLLDEHTSALDPKTAQSIMALTKQCVTQYQMTCVMTTHDMDVALAHGDRLLAIKAGQIHCDYLGVEKRQLHRKTLLDMCY
jgi:putative ABC transport system ATP-binding protein